MRAYQLVLASLVVGLCLVMYGVAIFDRTFKPPPEFMPLAGIGLGFILGEKPIRAAARAIVKSMGEGNGNGNKKR